MTSVNPFAFIPLAFNPLALTVLSLILVSPNLTFADGSKNGEISGFRYQTCKAAMCMVVEAPRAWLSTANGAFVAERTDANAAFFRILKERKSIREVNATEVVLRPEIGMMTVETETDVLLVDLETYDVETVKK